MQIHWPLVISTVCQRAGLGLYVCVWAVCLLGASLPLETAAWVTLALLVLGGCASIFHLQRPARFFNAFSNFKSHLTQEGALTPFLGLALLLVGFGVVPEVSSTCAAVLAAAFLLVTGLAYQMKSRPAWNTPLVLALFVLSALAAGLTGAALLACATVPDLGQAGSDAGAFAAKALVGCALVGIVVCLGAQIAYVKRMRAVGYGVAYDAMKQPYRPVTMAWCVFAGISLALVALALIAPQAAIASLAAAFAGILVSIGAWTVLFFKGAHKVRMFLMYPVDLNVDM